MHKRMLSQVNNFENMEKSVEKEEKDKFNTC